MRHDVDRFVESVGIAEYRGVLQDLLVAIATRNVEMANWARERLARITADVMGSAELFGARLALREAAGAVLELGAAMAADVPVLAIFRDDSGTTATVPSVPLQEAIDDLVTRTPVTLRDAARRTGQEISRLYSQGRVVAFAHSAEQAVTDRVHELIVKAVREGHTEGEAVQAIRIGVDEIRAETHAWTDAYARTAFRTNVNTAVTAGRFRQAQDPDVQRVVPCLRYEAIGDADTRPNHMAADGIVMKSSNPEWRRIAPPMGFNCRCSVSLVTLPELRRMGRIRPDGSIVEDSVPAGAFPDPGFRHGDRPDLAGVA